MELSKAIRTGYFQLLNGAVLHNATPVPVFDVFALPEVNYPYILLSSQTSFQTGAKTCKMYDATILIDIVTGGQQMTGRGQAEDIAEQVENLINPDNGVRVSIEANGYQILTTYRRSDTDLGSKSGIFHIYRKLMRYEHKITKL